MNRTNRQQARDPQPDAGWLTAALREQAHQHEPDSGRISARFELLISGEHRPSETRRAQSHGAGPRQVRPSQVRPRRAEPRRVRPRRAEPRRSGSAARLRLIGIPLGLLALASAIVAVVVSLGLGNTPAAHPSSPVAASRGGGPGATAATSGPGPLSASSAALPTATAPAATGPAATQPAATPVSSGPSGTGPAGPLTAAGAVDPHSSPYWAQENLTVTTTLPIRELDVTVAVSGGQSVRSTGMWTTLFPSQVETTVRSEPDGLVYEITLKPGQTLQPTAYKFGFQFNRPSTGHEFASDTYRATAVTADGASESATGAF